MSEPELTVFEIAREAQARALKRRRRKRSKAAAPQNAMPAFSPTQRKGFDAEAIAAEFLSCRGLVILTQNLRCKSGEIDLAANDNGTLVFIEVKYRRQPGYGGAAASVNRAKQIRLIRCARFFLPRLVRLFFSGEMPKCRFDVIAIESSDISWIRDAFNSE